MNLTIRKESEVAAINEEELKRLASLVSKEDEVNEGLAVLKINYDNESKIAEPGQWVLGQRKGPDGVITEEGLRVIAMIPIVTRNAYSYYNQKDPKLNCNSPLFTDYREEIRGSRLKNICGPSCPMREKEGSDKCKAQKIVFGIAVTEKDGLIDFIYRAQGASFMPLANYIDEAKVLFVNGRKVNVPICTNVCALGSEKNKNGSIVYYIPTFEKSGILSADDIEKLVARRDEIGAYIDNMNARITTEVKVEEEPKPGTKAADPEPSESVDVIDAEIEKSKVEKPASLESVLGASVDKDSAEAKDDTPFDPTEPSKDNDDIASAIAGILSEIK